MRIISGKFKSRQALKNKSFNARPTTDFAKEGIFDILNNYFFFDKARVLDLFSGTGSISLEFISRGCRQVELVEIDYKNIRLIKEALKLLGVEEITLINGNAFKYLDNCKPGYDIIFADPPYDLENLELIAEKIFSRNLLNTDGWFILEHSKFNNFEKHPNFKEERKYGNVHFSIFLNTFSGK